MLPCASAVFCSSGSSSTRTSVMTTSAPWRASVSASWRPRPRGAREWPPLGGHPAVSPDEQPRGVDLHRHVGELEPDRLVLPQRLAELLAVLRVVERELICGPRDPEGARANAGPRRLQRRQGAK